MHTKRNLLLVSIVFFTLISFVGCESKNNDFKECNTSLNLSENILDYVPDNIKSDVTLSNYLKRSFDSFRKIHDDLVDFISNYAEINNILDVDIAKTDDNDPVALVKGALKIFGSATKGAWKGGKLMISSADILDYKSNYYEYKKTYSKTMIDSLKHVIDFISINNQMIGAVAEAETKRIDNSSSIRSTPQLSKNIIKESGLEENLKLFENLSKESNKIIRILLLNKMNGIECSKVEDETIEMLNFMQSDNRKYNNHLDVFNDYSKLMNKIKLKMDITKSYIKKNENIFHDQIVNELNRIAKQYEEEINMNISSLNVYKRIEPVQKEIQVIIKKRGGKDFYLGEIYF